MENTEKINIRGSINALEVNSDPLELLRTEYLLSSVRAIAGAVTGDTGKTFNVAKTDSHIVVTRLS